ncbi:Na+/H+ antiporter subunit E [Quadrisphaera setariae]|uniref:Cation transporter n=1 Tax=Quadrisphaera setariae TaxID=2593304 RepID=A0A5C8ZFJ4_9ACTN|nr:Na+/H+ antiporter subunit E [Quadrisphaera setariae]TXR55938.1 cation transporter [Quadrisphaera setariae]
MSGLRRPRHAAVFVAAYSRDFLRANAQVVREVLTPGSGVAPAVLRVTLRSRTPFEVATLAALVGLTPGSVVLAVDDPAAVVPSPGDPRGDPGSGGLSMTVHAMHAHDLEAERAALHRLEDRLLAVLRGAP